MLDPQDAELALQLLREIVSNWGESQPHAVPAMLIWKSRLLLARVGRLDASGHTERE